MGVLTEVARGLRAAIPFPGGQGRTFVGWGGEFYGGSAPFRLPDEQDYSRKVGDGSGTALITAAVNWMARELIPARPTLLEWATDDGPPRTIRRHPVLDLLRQPTRDPLRAPNGYYDGTTMRMAMALSWIVDGNVYRVKARSPEGRVVQRWWVPHWMIEPVGTNETFIKFYRYSVGGQRFELGVRDVDHLRFGLDPQNPRKGMSPIRGVLRELLTDEEAARFSAALLINVGFPGAVVIPGKDVVVNDEGIRKEIRDTFDERFRGEGRGRTIVLSANAEVKFLQWTPQELDLSTLRDVPEERVSAAVGIPAAVLGWGTGLQQVKVGATMRELRSMAWEGALIPFLEAVAENETSQLLPEFIGPRDLPRFELGWDLSRIAALSDVQMRRAEIEANLVRARIKRVDEARVTLGLPAVGGGDGGFMAQPGVGAPVEDEGDEDRESDEGDEGDESASLSPREREMAELAGRGLANKEIAARAGLSERTVERYLASARTKLGVIGRAELGAWLAKEEMQQ